MRRLNKVKIKWSAGFAYAIGLLATDGNLSPDGRHINLTSKDRSQIMNLKKCLQLKNKIGKKGRGNTKIKKYYQIQFGDKNFYEFLIKIGLTPAKSKSLENIFIPDMFFRDFLRGCIDGDGNIDVFSHPESKHQQLRLRLFSASIDFLSEIKKTITKHLLIAGGWLSLRKSVYILTYGKKDAIKLLGFIYYKDVDHFLKRKYNIAKKFLK